MPLPIDGFVIDHTVNKRLPVYLCSYCAKPTTNYTKDLSSGLIEPDHVCDECFASWQYAQPFD